MSRAVAATARQRRHRPPGTGHPPDTGTLIALNAAGATAAAAFAALGTARPGYIGREKSPDAPAGFWAASSAIRTWAITIPLLAALVRPGRLSPELLTVAGLVQLGDSALGIRQHNPRMTIAPALMGIIHLASARQVARSAAPDDRNAGPA